MAGSARVAPGSSKRRRRRICPRARRSGNLRALVIYLRFTQGIAFERLATLLSDILGLEISEGALVNMLDASRGAFAAQRSTIRARLLSGPLCNRTKPACGSAKATGGCGCFITATAPSLSPSLRGPRRWSRISSAIFGLTTGCPIAMAASWVRRTRKIKSAPLCMEVTTATKPDSHPCRNLTLVFR